MKTRIILSFFFSIFLINGVMGQVVNVAPNPSTTQQLNSALLLDQEVWLAGGYPTFFYSSSWTECYDFAISDISGVKNQNGQNVVYGFGRDGQNIRDLYKWSNVSKKWSIIPNRPYYLQYGAVIKVVNENCIYLLSQAASSPKLCNYTGTSFVELYKDTAASYYENFLYADNNRVIFSRVNSGILLSYEVGQDTVVKLVSIPNITGIRDVKSANGVDFFILSKEGNLYVYLGSTQILVDLIICSESEKNQFNETMEVASTNRLIFLGGSKGIKKVWISNNGDPISEVIFSITNPAHTFLSSSHYGSRMIFAGVYGSFELQTAQHVIIDYTTGVVEPSLPDINIYPNPSEDWIKIDGLTKSSNIQIFDITCKLILSQEYQLDDRIDISSLTTGMYILNIRNSEGVSSKKIIKQ